MKELETKLAKIKRKIFVSTFQVFSLLDEKTPSWRFLCEDLKSFLKDLKSVGGEMTGLYLLGGLLTHSCTQNTRCVFKVILQSND